MTQQMGASQHHAMGFGCQDGAQAASGSTVSAGHCGVTPLNCREAAVGAGGLVVSTTVAALELGEQLLWQTGSKWTTSGEV
jgi:hypothetical protein